MAEPTLVVCPLLRREIDALQAAGRVDGRVETLARGCDPSPAERVVLADALARRAASGGRATVLGGGCLREVARPGAGADPVRYVESPTCFELLAPAALVDHLTAQGAHLVTPGWLAQWRKALATWGLDRQTARELFAESARRLVLLDTGVDPSARASLAELAEYLGLPSEVLPVGLDHLALRLRDPQGPAVTAPPSTHGTVHPSQARRLADYGAVLDFTARLATAVEEPIVLERLADLGSALFAPERIVFVPIVGGAQLAPVVTPAEDPPDIAELAELSAFAGRATVAADGASLLVRVGDPVPLGLLRLTRVAFPKFLDHYVDLVWLVAEATSLALLHARSHRALREAEAALRVERDELEARVRERTAELEHTVGELREAASRIRTLHGLLPICCGCKKIRDDSGYWGAIEEYLVKHSEATFSHGLCPECFTRLYPELADEPDAPRR